MRSGIQTEIKIMKEERAKSPHEQLFDLWIKGQEEEMGHKIDTTSQAYRDARQIYLGY